MFGAGLKKNSRVRRFKRYVSSFRDRIESVIGSYADYSLDETQLFIHDVDVTKEVIIVPAKDVVKIENIK